MMVPAGQPGLFRLPDERAAPGALLLAEGNEARLTPADARCWVLRSRFACPRMTAENYSPTAPMIGP